MCTECSALLLPWKSLCAIMCLILMCLASFRHTAMYLASPFTLVLFLSAFFLALLETLLGIWIGAWNLLDRYKRPSCHPLALPLFGLLPPLLEKNILHSVSEDQGIKKKSNKWWYFSVDCYCCIIFIIKTAWVSWLFLLINSLWFYSMQKISGLFK